MAFELSSSGHRIPTSHEVIRSIQQTFAGVGREDGVTLHETREIDLYSGPHERAVARLLDTDEMWEQVPAASIAKFSEALCFLDPKGFRYYIPAFMIWTIKNYRKSDSCSGDYTLYALCRLDKSDSDSTARLNLLNDRQRSAIAMFLLYFSSEAYNEEIVEVIHRFWRGYLPDQ
jgi:hypothetical protein